MRRSAVRSLFGLVIIFVVYLLAPEICDTHIYFLFSLQTTPVYIFNSQKQHYFGGLYGTKDIKLEWLQRKSQTGWSSCYTWGNPTVATGYGSWGSSHQGGNGPNNLPSKSWIYCLICVGWNEIGFHCTHKKVGYCSSFCFNFKHSWGVTDLLWCCLRRCFVLRQKSEWLREKYDKIKLRQGISLTFIYILVLFRYNGN